MSIESGVLYVVATPLGNLGDFSQRAVEVLRQVAVIAAEDTRRSAILMHHYKIATPLVSLHEHNEDARSQSLLERLRAGDSLALISDAGTPLISDPGFRLVQAAHDAGIKVSPVPGPCAMVAALCVAGVPAERFAFEGFLPAKSVARRQRLQELKSEQRTLVLYESSHRIRECLADAAELLGGDRQAVLARELTKIFETVRRDALNGLVEWLDADADRRRGEFVLIISGDEPRPTAERDAERVFEILNRELPPKQAARLAADICGMKANDLYRLALVGKKGQE